MDGEVSNRLTAGHLVAFMGIVALCGVTLCELRLKGREAFGFPGPKAKRFEGTYLHRTSGRDYFQTKLTREVQDDGIVVYMTELSEYPFSLSADAQGRPVEYKGGNVFLSNCAFTKDLVTVTQRLPRAEPREVRFAPQPGALPDFNSRPDPYLTQHLLIQAYDVAKRGKQALHVYDVDDKGTGFREYEITLELVDEDGVPLPNGKFKAKHFVQVQQSDGGTWFKKRPGSQTDIWVDDDLVILRIFRHREPYEVVLQDYNNPNALISAAVTAQGLSLDCAMSPAIKERLERMQAPPPPKPPQQVEKPPAQADAPVVPEQFHEALRAFIEEIDRTYPFLDLKGIRKEWESCKARLLERVKECGSHDAFCALLDEAARCLRDGHMGFTGLKGRIPYPEDYYPGVAFLPAANDQVVIMATVPEYEKALPRGVIVTHIDGKPARALLDQQAAESWKRGGYFSSPQRARLRVYRTPLRGKQGEVHEIVVVEDGAPRTVKLENKWPARGWPHTYAMPQGLKRHGGSCQYGKLPSGYGYIHLRRIDQDFIPAIDAAMASFGDISGLIVDLRGNGGGGYGPDFHKRFDKKAGPQGGVPFYNVPVVVLIDEGTMSAGETVARDLVLLSGAYVMGSPSAGCSSAKRQWSLPHGLGQVTLPERSRHGLDDKPIEFHGVIPHQMLEIVPSELRAGVNSGIKRAEEYLAKLVKKQ